MARTRIIPGTPALLVEGRERVVVMADLHLGFEASLDPKISLGKHRTISQTISDVRAVLESASADLLVLLGDVKSGTGSITKNEWRDIPRFFEEASRICEITLVPGNHDSGISKMLPRQIRVSGTGGLVLDGCLLTHGHAMPPDSFSEVTGLVMGHVHPVLLREDSVLNGQRLWVQLCISRQDLFSSRTGSLDVVVMPSFNRYLHPAGRRIHKPTRSPIIRRMRGISSARVMTLDGAIIGGEEVAKDVLGICAA